MRFLSLFLLALLAFAPCAEAAYPTPYAKIQFFDNSGNPLSGGKVYSYTSGTTTPKNTYTDSTEGTPNANPAILDSAGRANIWLGTGGYKLILKTSADVTIWTVDGVPGNGSFSGNLTVSGNATIGGTLGVTGNFAVNTNKFTVTASSGDTAISGALLVAGDIGTTGAITGTRFGPTGAVAAGNNFYLPATNTLGVAANSLDVARFLPTASAVNYLTFQGAATSGGILGTTSPNIAVAGTDADIPLTFSTKGIGNMSFQTNSNKQFDIVNSAVAVNNLAVTGSPTGVGPSLYAEGADTNINMNFTPKGTGKIVAPATTSITSLNTAKAQARIVWTAGVPATVGASNLNISSVSDTGVGDVTINLGVTFASTDDILATCSVYTTAPANLAYRIRALTTTSVRVQVISFSGTLTDPDGIMCEINGKI